MQRFIGFSLLELMLVLAIIGILSTLCIPIYSQHIAHEKRFEAEMLLIKIAAALEQYYTINNTYQDATLEKLGFSDSVVGSRYQISIQSNNASHFLLAANATEKQSQNDSACVLLTLNELDEKKSADCW